MFIWLFSISPVANTMLRWLESDYVIPQNPQGDVIILLGERVDSYVPDIFGIGTPSGTTLNRMIAAVKLQKNKDIPVIVSHGKDRKSSLSKGSIIKRYLVEFGIPRSKIILEERSRNTFENVRYSVELCTKNDFKFPIVVTSAYHMKRSILSFNKLRKQVIAYPAHFLSWENREYSWESFLPKNKNLKNSSIALKEYLGLVFYNLFY
jgi:uncharacterized SAM-binding protein YcdF (DUF218 family)